MAPIPMVPAAAGYEHFNQRDRITCGGVASREALLQRLETIGALAPAAPLSFLVVHVGGLGLLADPETGPSALSAVARQVAELTGPLDLAGRYGASGIGIVLQGKGARQAAAVAARLQWCLDRLPEVRRPLFVEVFAASGTGENAPVLPKAAGDSLPDAG
jgi:GGDEF domain-containing protein